MARHFFQSRHCFLLATYTLWFYMTASFVQGWLHPPPTTLTKHRHQLALQAQADGHPNAVSSSKVYFDISVADEPLGRLVFHLANPSPLPLHTENLIQLAKGSRRGIDPLAHYVGCQFDFTPANIEDGQGRYRWSHICKGRGRNAVGKATEPIVDAPNQLASTYSCFGGQYYGSKYNEDDLDDDDPGVLLTVAIRGPRHGSSQFSIVRVKESPQEWGERLLLNSGVIGRMQPSSLGTLHAMARQRIGPPTVTACGTLDE